MCPEAQQGRADNLFFKKNNNNKLTLLSPSCVQLLTFSIFQFPIMNSVCPPNFAKTIVKVVKCSWRVCIFPRVFHNSLCKTWWCGEGGGGQSELWGTGK